MYAEGKPDSLIYKAHKEGCCVLPSTENRVPYLLFRVFRQAAYRILEPILHFSRCRMEFLMKME